MNLYRNMSILKRVNIIGSEMHGSRYRDAALFYPTVETLACNDSRFAAYDTVIVAEPYLWDDSLAERLVSDGFCGLLILEKMPVCSWEAFTQFSQKEYPFRICHAMLRLFEDRVLDTEAAHLTVQWPNLIDSHMIQTRHTLPNALLFCRAQLSMGTDSVRELTRTDCSLNVTLVNENHHIDLEIYNTKDTTACVRVNDTPLRWPNYIQLIHRLFDAVREGGGDWRINETMIGEIIKVMEATEKMKGRSS